MNCIECGGRSAGVLTLLAPGLVTGGVIVTEAESVGGVSKSSAGVGDGVEDVVAVEIDLDGVCPEETFDTAHQHGLDVGVLGSVHGPWSAVSGARRLDHGHAFGQAEGVFGGQDLVHEGEELVLDARDRVFAKAVVVDGVHEAVSRLDGVATVLAESAARLLAGGGRGGGWGGDGFLVGGGDRRSEDRRGAQGHEQAKFDPTHVCWRSCLTVEHRACLVGSRLSPALYKRSPPPAEKTRAMVMTWERDELGAGKGESAGACGPTSDLLSSLSPHPGS